MNPLIPNATPCSRCMDLDSGRSPEPYKFSWFDWFCLWYPPGWLILFNRHWQHYHHDPDGWNGLEYALFLIPCGFYLALLLRWLRLGCRSPRPKEGTRDPSYQAAFRQELLTPILHHYFRAELENVEELAASGPLIVVMNHAGMCFPWDFMALGVLLSQTRDWFVQPLAHELFFDHPWLRWWLPAGWSQVLGGVRATRDGLETALADGKMVLLYAPEGWRGLMKGWSQRHHLETFDPSFMQLSDHHQVPIQPILCLGNEYCHPWAWNMGWVARRVGLPIFPLSPLILVFMLFPSMGVWVMPARLRYYVQSLEQPWMERSPVEQPLRRSVAYQEAQALRWRLQSQLQRLRSALKQSRQG